MFAIRVQKSNARVTMGQFYKVTRDADVYNIIDNNGKKMQFSPSADYWWLTNMPHDSHSEYRPLYRAYESALRAGNPELKRWIKSFEDEQRRVRTNRPNPLAHWEEPEPTHSEQSQLTKKEPTMANPIKIEDTKLINGKLLADYTPDELIRLIKHERQALEAINDLKIASKYIAKVRATHQENIEKLVEILDTFADEQDAQAE